MSYAHHTSPYTLHPPDQLYRSSNIPHSPAASNPPSTPNFPTPNPSQPNSFNIADIPLSVLVVENAEVKKLWENYHGALNQIVKSNEQVVESSRCIQSVFVQWRDAQSQPLSPGESYTRRVYSMLQKDPKLTAISAGHQWQQGSETRRRHHR